jgi:hypothetical protein
MFFPKINVKIDPVRRWHRPDRHFFANGACQVLAFAFLERYPDLEFRARWIKPAAGFSATTSTSPTGSMPSTITASPPNSACSRWSSGAAGDSFPAGTPRWWTCRPMF